MLAHAGASGVGTAAIQLVRLFGAVPIVTAGSPEKLKMAENLGAAAGFNYKEESFAPKVDDFTGGKLGSAAHSAAELFKTFLLLLLIHNSDLSLSSYNFTGKGVNIILDSVGGHIWEENVRCLATDGRWVLYGTMGGRAVQRDLLGKLLSKRGHLLSSLLRSRSLQVR